MKMLVNNDVKIESWFSNMELDEIYDFSINVPDSNFNKTIYIPSPKNAKNMKISGVFRYDIKAPDPELNTTLQCKVTVNDDIDNSLIFEDDSISLSKSHDFIAKKINTISIKYIIGDTPSTLSFKIRFH